MVADAESLERMIQLLRAAGTFAFDSEFIGEASYEPRLCLMQTATMEQVFLVDPLGEMDLLPLWELIADASVEKVVLAGQQDFIPAVARTGKPPANVLDVQIAAGFIHAEYPLSLTRLVERFVGVPLGKGLAFTHWDQRPLSPVQVRYAADDVRYLPAARKVIVDMLSQAGRLAWAHQECHAVLGDVSLYCPAPEDLYLRVRGRDRLWPRHLATLRELAIWRDRTAKAEDVPPRTLLKDQILVKLARRPVKCVEDLDAVSGLPRPVEEQYGQQIVEATARGLAAQRESWPEGEPEESPQMIQRSEDLWARIGLFCTERSMAPSLVTSRKDIVRALRLAAAGKANEHRLFSGWRKEFLGDVVIS